MKLLIVESPAKCKKIQGYLGDGWRVSATMGHIRALKEDLAAIGFRASWEPTYEYIKAKSEAVSSLRRAAKGAEIYLGSDDDREGEAIAWHTCMTLELDPRTTKRVVFHEITESAIKKAVANPTRINMNTFYSQQARTMLDFMLGFTLSPMLWRGVGFKPGLSAGRCQTPALRIVYDRDNEIANYQSKSSWKLTADTIWEGEEQPNEEAMMALLEKFRAQKPRILTLVDRKERIATHKPPQAFITSSLQQEASSRLSMNPKVTMRMAQNLYEAGHITYMRTDNPNLSQEAIVAASAYVQKTWGDDYLASVQTPDTNAPHEAIRPTHMEESTIEDLGAQEQRLYAMIWRRTIHSVMVPETCDTVSLTATACNVRFQTEWSKVRFSGWRILDADRNGVKEKEDAETYEERKDWKPPRMIQWAVLRAGEHHTQPPSRYTEASLIRELESREIGRPSTYATLVDTVMERGYVEKSVKVVTERIARILELRIGIKVLEKKEKITEPANKLTTTALGRSVIEWLLANIGDMVSYELTATMERMLDEVAKGSRDWKTVLTETWGRYEERYDATMAAKSQTNRVDRADRADLGGGYKILVSKKGPLFVLEKEGEKTRFAKVPSTLSVQTATREDAERAFSSNSSAEDDLGEVEGDPVLRKKGPYGYYVSWRTYKVSCSEDETIDDIRPRLLEKITAIDHQVGGFRIKKGAYGLYMYKTGLKGKPTFVGIPDSTDFAALTPEGAENLYKQASTKKK